MAKKPRRYFAWTMTNINDETEINVTAIKKE
jgi:hypothetical protein